MSYTLRYIYDHVAIYSLEGAFILSADTREEAMRFMEEYLEEFQD